MDRAASGGQPDQQGRPQDQAAALGRSAFVPGSVIMESICAGGVTNVSCKDESLITFCVLLSVPVAVLLNTEGQASSV